MSYIAAEVVVDELHSSTVAHPARLEAKQSRRNGTFTRCRCAAEPVEPLLGRSGRLILADWAQD